MSISLLIYIGTQLQAFEQLSFFMRRELLRLVVLPCLMMSKYSYVSTLSLELCVIGGLLPRFAPQC